MVTNTCFASSCDQVSNDDVFHFRNKASISQYLYCTPVVYFGDYGGRLISESGKIDRDITLLKMRQNAGYYPWLILGGDTVFRVSEPKLPGKPFYILDEMSAELQNLRVYFVNNLGPWAYTEVNYQVNTHSLLDAYLTLGNLDYSPLFATIGQQYVPTGNYNKYEVDANPLNKSIFRINQQAITVSSLNKNHTYRAYFVKNNDYNEFGFGASYGYKTHFKSTKLEMGIGFLNNANNMSRALMALDPASGHNLPMFDIFSIAHHGPYDFRAEWTQLLKPTEYSGRLATYDLEAQYKFQLWKKRTKLIFAYGGMLNYGNLIQNQSFASLGLFKRQYVLSIKRNLKPKLNLGLSAIFGNELNNKLRHQFVLTLVYKV